MAHKQLIAYSLLLQVCQSDPAGGAGRRLQCGGGGQGSQRHRGPHAGLHERPGHDLLDVRPHDADEVVRLDRPLLLLHQLRQHQAQRRHQADHEQFHALHLRCGHVLPPEPHADDFTLLRLNKN